MATKSNDTNALKDVKSENKGQRRNSKFKGKKTAEHKNQEVLRSGNAINSQRLKDMTALNLDYPISTDIGQIDIGSTAPIIKENNVYTVKYGMTMGSPDAAMLAAQKIFGDLRKVLNVPSTYEAGDLFMYMMAIESLDIAVEEAKRVVRLANTFVSKNILYPRMVLTALGYNIDEVVENLPKYREAINKTITAMQYLSIPSVTQSHALRMQLAHYIITDDEDDKAQNIVFMSEGFWKWNVASGSSTTPSDLTWVTHANSAAGYHTYGTLGNLLSDLLSSLLYDQDGQRIHGDILKVWGDAIKLGGAAITAEEYQERKFDPYILYMLHNATIHAGIGSTTPTITWVIPTGGTSPTLDQKFYVNTYKPAGVREIIDCKFAPTSEDIMNYCRWKSETGASRTSSTFSSNEVIGFTGSFCPLEVLTEMQRWEFDSSTFVGTPSRIYTHARSTVNMFSQMYPAFNLSIAPLIYIMSNIGTSSNPNYFVSGLWGDRNYWTIVDSTYLARLNLLATELNYSL